MKWSGQLFSLATQWHVLLRCSFVDPVTFVVSNAVTKSNSPYVAPFCINSPFSVLNSNNLHRLHINIYKILKCDLLKNYTYLSNGKEMLSILAESSC